MIKMAKDERRSRDSAEFRMHPQLLSQLKISRPIIRVHISSPDYCILDITGMLNHDGVFPQTAYMVCM